MRETQKDGDLMAELERLDRFIDGEEPGVIPLEVLRERGLELPDDAVLDDEALHAKLWETIEAMAGLGLFLDSTDHLSDRELYRYLLTDALAQEEMLSEMTGAATVISPIGGFSEEDLQIYLRYYADEQTWNEWPREPGETVPPRETPPYDRDRLLPNMEARLHEGLQ